MKNKITLLVVLQLFLMLGACSSDSGSDSAVEPIVVKTPKITAFSKNSGEIGETITLSGEDLSDKISEIKITFDEVSATIVSATTKEITFILPNSEKVLPKFALTIADKKVINEVKNDYKGAIGILPKPSTSDWFTMENTSLINDLGIHRIQQLSESKLYYSIDTNTSEGTSIYRTLDGGITWILWAHNTLRGGFYVTANDEGWADRSFAFSKISKEGYLGFDEFAKFEDNQKVSVFKATYVDDEMKNGTCVTYKGKVYTTNDGINFRKAYEVNITESDVFSLSLSTQIDNDHMWVIGSKRMKGRNDNLLDDRPFILFKNNTTDGWKEYPFIDEGKRCSAKEIYFVDKTNGFLLIDKYNDNTKIETKLFKTANGGDSWEQIYNQQFFTKFTFKDANTGWAIAENKIYKTVDGAASWTLDYTHDQPIKAISYKNNVVWAISKDKIIKRYLK